MYTDYEEVQRVALKDSIGTILRTSGGHAKDGSHQSFVLLIPYTIDCVSGWNLVETTTLSTANLCQQVLT